MAAEQEAMGRQSLGDKMATMKVTSLSLLTTSNIQYVNFFCGIQTLGS